MALPLFTVRALDWDRPEPDAFDALFLTSANALHHGGAGLARYRSLPVFAVGAATAAAAREAEFAVAAVATGDAAELAALAQERGVTRALHLAGRDRAHAHLPGVAATIAVYASDPRDIAVAELARLAGGVALVHSPRAGARLAALVRDRETVRIAAISETALAAAGPGWGMTAVAARPDDTTLIAIALTLAD